MTPPVLSPNSEASEQAQRPGELHEYHCQKCAVEMPEVVVIQRRCLKCGGICKGPSYALSLDDFAWKLAAIVQRGTEPR